MSRTEDLLNDNGPSPSMSIASKAPQKEGGSKSDGLDKDHIAVSSPFYHSEKADGLGQHFNMGEALLNAPTDRFEDGCVFMKRAKHEGSYGWHAIATLLTGCSPFGRD